MSEFEQAIAKNIRDKVRQIKCKGTVGISISNLCQITPTPNSCLNGAPAGPGPYAAMFAKVARQLNIQGFDIYE